MEHRAHHSLTAMNTFGVETHAENYVRFVDPAEIADFLQHSPLAGAPRLILGGGSNLLFVGDVPGVVLHPVLRGIDVVGETDTHVLVRAMAGECWDDLVAVAVENGWGGLENLSRIPGSVGASVVQNIGAYGVEVASCTDHVQAIDLDTGKTQTIAAGECGFGYRHSHFKGPWAGRFMVTAVVFRMTRRPALCLDYPGVRAAVAALGPVSLTTVRRAIIQIREGKLPDPATLGNAGSFFKNPVVDGAVADNLAARHPDMPRYPQADGRYKLAAGWLIDQCGWKGRRLGRAAVHDRQALVIVNLGGATGQEILALSRRVRASVQERFGIRLEREVQVVPKMV